MSDTRPEVLFVCVHNAGRSQMAAALLAQHAGDAVVVRSAGSAPAEDINPVVVDAMNELGIDLRAAGVRPKRLDEAVVRASDVVITMGCGDACPIFPGKRYEDWVLEDPAGLGVDGVRAVRDEIDRRVRALVADLVPAAPASGSAASATTSDGTDASFDEAQMIRTVAGRLAVDFEGILGVETIERFVEDSLDQLLPTARITTYLPLLAERFARERLRALGRLDGSLSAAAPGVLFLCVHNAGRSQMAAGWLRYLAGDQVVVWSAGSEPTSEINPAAVTAMAEVGIDITEEFPKPWTDEIVRAADVVVTMGCGDACPIFPGKRYEDWELQDPAGLGLDGVRVVRDDIRARVEGLLESLAFQPMAGAPTSRS